MKKLLIGSFLVAVGAACTSSSSPGGGNDPACDRYFNALTKYAMTCGGRVLSPDQLAHDLGRFRRACQIAIAAPGTGVNVGWINSCAATVEALGCNDSSNTDACKLPSGTLGVGGACASDDQCVAATFCKRAVITTTTDAGTSSQSAQCGTCTTRTADGSACDLSSASCMIGSACRGGLCVAITKADVGASCAQSANATCKPGLLCDQATQLCKAYGATGDACRSSFECRTELLCANNACAPRPVEGAPCTQECAAGLACDGTKCVKRTFGKPGDPCDGRVLACEAGSCVGATPQQKGTCSVILADGAACDRFSTDGRRCDEYASCTNGTCQIEDPSTCK